MNWLLLLITDLSRFYQYYPRYSKKIAFAQLYDYFNENKLLHDCSSFIRHLRQSIEHIKWSSKIVHKNNTIRAYNHTTYITRGYSASQVSCTHVLVVWISSNQFHASHLGQYCNWFLYMVLPQCQWRRKLGWQAHVLTHGNTQYI